ncbi:lipopolysaccharide biosynthesis protein [Geminocystis sp. NIES-3709]|uniref:lipopolysaccharide biosynthesis protein n=1 Tax=Geminocystis sp. NIES-3709 TaxID=1617448 RepID=UPI0005FC9B6B|nr:lipopolysaccharide biosynthesis protein [Geminocystis sp. NIES-3709]BAQ65680.1 probable polysaccharide transport protein [Geminocystis sp. NIES-3709]
MSIKQKTIQGFFWSILQNWGSQAGSFIVFLILARLLTPEDFGLVSLANVLLALMNIFLEQGLSSALIQREKLEREHLDTVFCTQVIIGIFLTLISFFLADSIANIFNQPQLIPIIKCLSFLFIINSFGHVYQAILKRELNFKIMAIRSLIAIFISGILAIFIAFLGAGVWSLVIQQFVFESIVVLVMSKAVNWRPMFRFSYRHFQELFSFSFYVLSYQFMNFVERKFDNLLVGYFLGEIALGYYTIAHRILEVMNQLLVGTLNQVALPLFARLQNHSQSFLETFYRATQWTCLITFPIFSATIILSSELIITLFGEKWLHVIPIMQILSLGGIIYTITSFQKSAFLALGKPNLQLKLGLINSILNFVFCLTAVKWGVTAIALAYVTSNYIVFPIGQLMLNRLIILSWKTYLSKFLAPITCTLMMILGLLLTKIILTPYLSPLLILISCSIIGFLIYLVTLRIFFTELFKEILNLISGT